MTTSARAQSDPLDTHITDAPADRPRLAAEIESFAAHNGLSPAALATLSLCLDELIANALSHGGARLIHIKLIHITATLDGDTLHIRIEDDGTAFDPFTDAPPPPLHCTLDDRPPGGLGIFLVRQSVTEARYKRQGEHNVITLVMRVASAPFLG